MLREMSAHSIVFDPNRKDPFGAYPEPLPQHLGLELPDPDVLTQFCRKYRLRELAIWGHALEPSYPKDAPIEVMIGYAGSRAWVKATQDQMSGLLTELFGRECKVLERPEVDVSENPILRRRFFRSVKTLYLER